MFVVCFYYFAFSTSIFFSTCSVIQSSQCLSHHKFISAHDVFLPRIACGSCYLGVVSAGTASGPNCIERGILDGLVEPQHDVGGYVEVCPSQSAGPKSWFVERASNKGQSTKELFTDKWHYTIIDAFGHRDFIKNVSEADRLRLQ